VGNRIRGQKPTTKTGTYMGCLVCLLSNLDTPLNGSTCTNYLILNYPISKLKEVMKNLKHIGNPEKPEIHYRN